MSSIDVRTVQTLKPQARPVDGVLVVTAGARTEARLYYWAGEAYQKQLVTY